MAVEKTKSSEWEGAFKAFGETYNQILKNPQPMLLFIGIYTLLAVISLAIQGKSQYGEEGFVPYPDLIMLLFVLPLTVYGLAIARKKTFTVSELMQIDARKLILLWAVSLLVSLILIGSLVLLIFPVIWTLAWFALSGYALVDKNLGPIEALKESKRISEEHKGKVWGVMGVTILVSFIAGMFTFIPYIGVAATAFAVVWTTATAARLYVFLQK